jgi:hypothetical protein
MEENGKMEQIDYRNDEIYKIIHPEVSHVYESFMEDSEKKVELDENDFHLIAVRICEEREEDAIDFHVYFDDILELKDEDDWSEVNGCIQAIIEKYMKEKVENK